jgi:hypothetical protein
MTRLPTPLLAHVLVVRPPSPHLTAMWGPRVTLRVLPQSRHALALLRPATHHTNPKGITPRQPNPDAIHYPCSLSVRHSM